MTPGPDGGDVHDPAVAHTGLASPTLAHGGDLDPSPPVIAGYTIGRVLGSTGLSAVYAVVDAGGRELALKVSQRTGSTELLALQQTELELLARLHNPAVVQVHDSGLLDDGRPYILMEQVHGQSLRDFLAERRRLDVLQAISVVRNVADAMAYCHDMGVLHLDLKPSNIMVVDAHTLDVKVLDFGISRLLGSWDTTHAPVIAGTPGYVAPECLSRRSREKLDARADLYALGVIFYELIAGRLPFHAASASEMISKQVDGRYVPLHQRVPGVPVAVEQLIDSLLATDPGKRYPSAGQLARELRALYYAILAGDAAPGRPGVDASSEAGGVDERGGIGELALVPDDVPLAGRSAELGALLDRFLEVVATGESRSAMIIGPAGVGKTRLLSEFLSAPAVRDQALVAYGRCPELHGLVSYSSLRAALARLAHGVRSATGPLALPLCDAVTAAVAEDPAILCALVPELRDFVAPSVDVDLAMAPHGLAGTERVVRTISGLLGAVAAVQPVILLIEDAHWADAAVVHTLSALAQRDGLGRVLVLATSRPVESSRIPAGVAVIELALLDHAANDDLLSALARGGSRDTVEGLKQAIPLLAAGIPLFNKQVMRHLEIEGYLRRGDDGSLVMTSELRAGYAPPDSVSAALTLTIDQLPEGVRSILSVAARVERHFLLSDIAGLGLFSPGEIHAAVLEAHRRHLCHLDDDGATFVHDVIREHLVDRARRPSPRSPRADRATAARSRHTGRDARVPPRSSRRSRRPPPPSTSRAASTPIASTIWSARAGTCAARSRSTSSCRRRRIAIAISRARSRSWPASVPARQDPRAARAPRPRARGDGVAAARRDRDAAQRLRARVLRAGNFDQAMEYSQRSLAVHDPALAPYQCVPANMLGRALCAGGHFGPSIDVLMRGCELARETHDLVELSHSEGLLGTALAFVGASTQSTAHIAESKRLAEQLNNPARRLGVCLYQTLHAEAAGHWDDGVRSSAQLLAQAEELSMAGLYLYLGTMMAGRHHFHVGELSRARHLLRNAINLAQLMRMSLGVGWAYAFYGDTWFVSGDIDRAQAAYDHIRELAKVGTPDEYAVPMGLIGLAHCAARRAGDPAAIAALADEAVERLRAASNRAVLVHALERRAEALETVGEGVAARRCRAERAALIAQYRLPDARWRPTTDAASADVAALADVEVVFSADHDAATERNHTLSMTQSLTNIEGYLPEHVKSQ